MLPRQVAITCLGNTDSPLFFVAAFMMSTVVLFPSQPVEEHSTPRYFSILLYTSVVMLFFSVHTPIRTLLQLWSPEIVQSFIVPLKNYAALVLLCIVLYPIVKSIFTFYVQSRTEIQFGRLFMQTSVVFFCIALLITPMKLGIMGVGYAYMSVSPFGYNDTGNVIYKRVLMPAFASYLQMKGETLYFIFSLLCTFTLLYVVALFFAVRKIKISLLYLLSLTTSSFVSTQFQSPGYTEQLSYIFIAILFCIPLRTEGRMSIMTLSILAHEASVAVLVVIAYFLFNRKEFRLTLGITLLYILLWIGSNQFDVSASLATHNVGRHSASAWVWQFPFVEFLGIIFSYKLLWIFLLIGVFTIKEYWNVYVGLLVASIMMTLLGVDTTRLLGFSFIALLFALYEIMKTDIIPLKYQTAIMVINIVIPSVYVGVNAGVYFFPGLYSLLYIGKYFL